MSHRQPLHAIALLLALLMLTIPVGATGAISASVAAVVPPALSAQAALLLDADTGRVLFAHNEDARLPMASTTKIMTALIVAEQLNMTDAIRIDKRAVGVEGSSIYLYADEWLTVEQLLYALLLESANDAAVALALAVSDSVEAFADLMNQKALALGLKDTHFTNPHGLDDEAHYTTAHDLARIASAALAHPALKRIMSTKKMTIPLCDMTAPGTVPDDTVDSTDARGETVAVGTRVLLNHNKMLRYYDGAIGIKTGYTKRSGRCLVSAAERDGLTLIAVTLNAPDDWSDHTALLDYGFSSYSRITLCEVGGYQTLLPVSGGKEQYVLVAGTGRCAVTLPRDHAAITCVVQLPHFALAPIDATAPIGRLIFYCDTNGDGMREQIASTPLQPLYDVEALPSPSLLRRLFSLLGALFRRTA